MNQHHTLQIEDLTYGGDGIARLNGKAVFVPYTVPGDTVEVELTEDKGSFARACLVSVLEASQDRVEAPCPYFGQCGGCSWMCVSYPAQLTAKRNQVVSALSRIGKLPPEQAEALVEPAQGSKRELGYRNKLELACTYNEKTGFSLGLHAEKSHDIIPCESCLLVHKQIQKAPKALKGALRYLQGTQDLGIYRIGVRHSLRTQECEVALWTRPGAFPRKQVAQTLSSCLKVSSIVRVLADPGHARKIKGVEVLHGKGQWREQLFDLDFLVSAPSFFQVNTAQAERMIDLVREGLELDGDSIVADLYAGSGTFTLALADYTDQVYAVESAASSVRDLRRNADLNGVWVDVIGGDAAYELPGLGHLDALVVDPPRAGLAPEVPRMIAEAGPDRVAYISCNPSTWARDVERMRGCGYKLTRVTPVDLFPQTYHCEVVSIFERL